MVVLVSRPRPAPSSLACVPQLSTFADGQPGVPKPPSRDVRGPSACADGGAGCRTPVPAAARRPWRLVPANFWTFLIVPFPHPLRISSPAAGQGQLALRQRRTGGASAFRHVARPGPFPGLLPVLPGLSTLFLRARFLSRSSLGVSPSRSRRNGVFSPVTSSAWRLLSGGQAGLTTPAPHAPPRRLSPPAPPRGLKAARSPRNRASSCENTGSSSAHQLAASSPWPAARFSQRRPTWLRLRDRTPPRSLQGVLCVLPVPLKQPSRRFLPDAGCFQVFSVSFSRVHAWSGSALWVWTNAPPPQAPSSRRPQNVLGGPRSASLAHSSALAPRTCRPSPRLRLGQDVPRQRC